MRIPKTIARILAGGALIAIFFVGYAYGQSIPFSNQLQAFDTLRQTSVLIFGVVGAWLAVLFPMVHTQTASQKDAQDLTRKLFKPITSSLYIITYSLMAPLLAPLIKKVPYAVHIIPELRGVGFASLCVATAIQIYTLLLALQPFDLFKTETDLIIEKDACRKRYRGNITETQEPNPSDKTDHAP
ncbi:hypothetical protein [Nitratidesulfovibrio sp. 1201_IL3209]|uniref:hypothetical protein n=1 Tax=Nitratidesulfovibrio sp. 1201_IL3209 TaxID=3084053 RepID=UPI002FDB6417